MIVAPAAVVTIPWSRWNSNKGKYELLDRIRKSLLLTLEMVQKNTGDVVRWSVNPVLRVESHRLNMFEGKTIFIATLYGIKRY